MRVKETKTAPPFLHLLFAVEWAHQLAVSRPQRQERIKCTANSHVASTPPVWPIDWMFISPTSKYSVSINLPALLMSSGEFFGNDGGPHDSSNNTDGQHGASYCGLMEMTSGPTGLTGKASPRSGRRASWAEIWLRNLWMFPWCLLTTSFKLTNPMSMIQVQTRLILESEVRLRFTSFVNFSTEAGLFTRLSQTGVRCGRWTHALIMQQIASNSSAPIVRTN